MFRPWSFASLILLAEVFCFGFTTLEAQTTYLPVRGCVLHIERLAPSYEIWEFYSGEDWDWCLVVVTPYSLVIRGIVLLPVCYADDEGAVRVARHLPNRTHDPRSGCQDHHPFINWVQKTICCNLTSSATDDGRKRPKHVELKKLQ